MGEETLASTTNNAMMANELNTLIRLNFDAIEAYTSAIERLENADYRQTLEEFRADHIRHVDELKELVHWMGAAPAKTGDAMQILTRGRISIREGVIKCPEGCSHTVYHSPVSPRCSLYSRSSRAVAYSRPPR
ncbi:DUF2383 domain-containing protein [Ectopseudomonas oleovorans]|uniref:DUF2383 domain-containing protein n=1 Tax=Ectopseudomonas oleovorans (strain CECT 5344) TaxID=1182590 RepID=W6QQJ8_ECTO5|nr:DUF2383 domain-containing protein [Pseudomonas oleovorans]CDM38767.1 hypothetical protein BN5_0152 [Pseudomonas oleovorans CECT 5344]CDR89389.1 hypothetical protein PPSAL_0151 [Pseudomonas oleovorans]